MRSLGQPVGSLAADLIGVSMITCKNDRLLELLWFVGYCIEFPTQLAVRIGGGAEWNRRVMYRAIREGYVRLYRKKHKRHVIRSMSLTQKGFEYVVPPEIDKIPAARAKFIQAMEAMRTFRRKDGAIRWDLFRDLAEPERYLETFVVPTWAEHMRQHHRVTVSDQSIEAHAFSFQKPGVVPVAAHLIAARAYEDRQPTAEPPYVELS